MTQQATIRVSDKSKEIQNKIIQNPAASIGKESACNAGFDLWVGKIHWKRERLPTPAF